MIDFTIQQIGLDEKNESGIKAFSNNHQQHYVSALKMFKDNFLTGVGISNFNYMCENTDNYKDLTKKQTDGLTDHKSSREEKPMTFCRIWK